MTIIVSRRLVFPAAGLMLLALLMLVRDPTAQFLFRQGLQAEKEWQLEKATQYLQWALYVRPDFTEARFEKAACHQLAGDFLASQRELDQLTSASIEDLALRARLLNAVGVNQFNSNESDAATDSHRKSLELARRLGNRRLEARALIGLSRVLYHTKGQFVEALVHLQHALRMGRELSDKLVEADALRNIGVVHWWFEGELQRPLREYYRPALEIYRRQNELRSAAITLNNIGLIYGMKGDAFQSMKYLTQSLEIKQRIGDLAGLCDSYAALGNMYKEIENYRRAGDYYSKSLQLCRKIGYRLTQNEVETHLAGIFLQLGEFDHAIELFNRLLERERENPLLTKYRLLTLAQCHLLNGEPERARQYLERGLAMNRLIGEPDNGSRINALIQQGEIAMRLGDSQKAAQLLAQAEAASLATGEKIRWVHYNVLLAELMERQGRRDKMLSHLMDAADVDLQNLGLSDTPMVPFQHWRVYDRLFALLLRPGEDAQPALNGATRSGLEEELAFRFLEQIRYRSFRNFVVRLSDKKSDPHSSGAQELDALSRVERLAKRLKRQDSPQLRKQLRQTYADYEDAVLRSELTHPRYRLLHQAWPAQSQAVQRELDSDTAVVAYLFAGDRAFALVTTQSLLRMVALPITKANLAAKVKLLRWLIFNGAPPVQSRQSASGGVAPDAPARPQQTTQADWQPVAEDLRRVLIEPLEQSGALNGIRRLGLIAVAFLHDLPFAALARSEGDGKRFLIEDYSLFHTPSATFLRARRLSQNSPPLAVPHDRRMIGFGRNISDEPQLPPLSFAVEEVSAAADIFGGQVRINRQASETELKRSAPDFRFIHLAAHAVTEPEMPLLSRLKLQSSDQDDGNLTVREILDLGLDAQLVTLSACRTGQSFSSSGNQLVEVDRIGLIEAFLHAGAHSVLASLLPINDRTTTEFMKAFYQNLRSMDKADALAQTQRAMLRGRLSYIENRDRRQLTHPRNWAPFILVGDYR